MRPVAVAALDRVVRNEPGIAPASEPFAGPGPSLNVRDILVRNADSAPIKRRFAIGREVKDELVTVVDETIAVDGLVVAYRHVAIESGRPACRRSVDGNRLDPVDRVLELEIPPGHLRDLERNPGIGGLGADVQEQRPL